jgi:hypothetical protein
MDAGEMEEVGKRIGIGKEKERRNNEKRTDQQIGIQDWPGIGLTRFDGALSASDEHDTSRFPWVLIPIGFRGY